MAPEFSHFYFCEGHGGLDAVELMADSMFNDRRRAIRMIGLRHAPCQVLKHKNGELFECLKTEFGTE